MADLREPQATGAGHGNTTTHTASDPVSSRSVPHLSSSPAVEMTDLDASRKPQRIPGAGSQDDLNNVEIPAINSSAYTTNTPDMASPEETRPDDTAAAMAKPAGPRSSTDANTSADPLSTSNNNTPASPEPAEASDAPTPQEVARHDSAGIGPSIETIPAAVTTSSDAGPVLVITLLLTSGARHPYKIDEKYLTKRNVSVPDMTESGRKDPFSISVYTLKELILREWRSEWEPQPSSPSSIRLIYFGRLLDDKTPLKDCRFNADATNVVHMTVRPQDMIDEEDAAKAKGMGRDRSDNESTTGCRCVIQ
ncbi:Ubiquitin-like protein [Venustampulla echinocandica]|uniref:Ubiquitin-like protein n=1 Tax=Venustampulla echinocandica TaxID=2656787 RepID=A0A370TWG6_9HELO|nr:Ubiquitin-like protein [Venustampulla echinocandica]RDL39873.1 Ubiquitin-like protein [Venustampulla echinocandica]